MGEGLGQGIEPLSFGAGATALPGLAGVKGAIGLVSDIASMICVVDNAVSCRLGLKTGLRLS